MTKVLSIWTPGDDIVENAQVSKLARSLGCADYDELYALSLADPQRYWDAVNSFCVIRWRHPYSAYADFSRGREFPVWFPGGRLNWTDTLLDHADDGPDRPAVTGVSENGETETLTYGGLRASVKRVAAGLKAQGVGRGDRIGLLMENGVPATVTFLAISYIGAVAVPLFSGFGSDAILARLQSCDASVLVVTTGFERRGKFVSTRQTVETVRAAMPANVKIIQKLSPSGPSELWPGAGDWDDLVRNGVMDEPEVMETSDPFMLIYTSGTTGKPKGTVHTHGSFPIKVAHDSAVHFNVSPASTYCWPADMGWIAGALVLTSALSRGAHLVCYDGAPDYPDWGRLGRLIETHRITHFGSAPTLIRGLAANEAISTAADMSTVELLITAGESIASEHFTWFQTKMGSGNSPVINYTGGSEASGALLSSVVTRPIISGSFNARSPGVAVDVVNAEGHSITGEVGELVVREPFIGMTQSFWGDDERYLETYWKTLPGVWVQGDLAIHDADGNYVLVGRSDDTLKVAGKRVGPAEVEEIVVEIDGVKEVAVIGVDDPVKGQSIAVFLTASDNSGEGLVAEVGSRIRERLGRPFSPKAVYLVTDLPKTRSSKIMRRVVRSIYSGQPVGDVSSLVNPEAIEAIRAVLEQQNETVGV
ncbi:AMP-binding protein [Rhizobium glycinendophyticum]|uniref:acetate--CoA ligase n=1 Tax=Rhizobium glycinendophyticum TaxID=2589807 RepID=A0A504TUE2_9HYPH|nr:AMP-binding protein [Rhizobium glycinendophyticum]TPP05020.1 AMP-binding protein [Rhizobium glycinendophyticum]